MQTVRSFCRICTAVCGILVDVAGDEVVRVRGDQDHPSFARLHVPEGPGAARDAPPPGAPRTSDGAGRRGSSSRRRGTTCLDDLAARLRAIIERHGPEAIGVFFGSGVGMDAAGYRTDGSAFRRARHPGQVQPADHRRHRQGARVPPGGRFPRPQHRTSTTSGPSWSMYIGVNPVVSHGHTSAMPDPVTSLRALRTHAEVWVIDPRRSETARLASRHLAPRPGTDYAVLAFLVRELLARRAPTATSSTHRMRRAPTSSPPRSSPDTSPTPPTSAGVAEPDLLALLDAVRRAGPVAVVTGTGVTMAATHGNVTQWLAWVAHDPDRLDEPARRRVVPSRVRPPARVLRAARPPTGRALRSRSKLPPRRPGVPRRVAVRRPRRRDPRRHTSGPS